MGDYDVIVLGGGSGSSAGRGAVNRILELSWYHPTMSELMLDVARDAVARIVGARSG